MGLGSNLKLKGMIYYFVYIKNNVSALRTEVKKDGPIFFHDKKAG